MRGCAIRGRVSRKQGRDCIERVGMYFEVDVILVKYKRGGVFHDTD